MQNFISQEALSTIFTRENITLLLSIFGSAGTAFTMIYNFLINRKKIQMKVVGHKFGDTKTLVIYASFCNKSRLPISITEISIKVDDIYIPCVDPPIVAFEETIKTNGVVTSHHEYMTLALPINLGSLSGTSGYVCFEFPATFFPPDATQLKFSINSNRGKVFEKILPIGPELD